MAVQPWPNVDYLITARGDSKRDLRCISAALPTPLKRMRAALSNSGSLAKFTAMRRVSSSVIGNEHRRHFKVRSLMSGDAEPRVLKKGSSFQQNLVCGIIFQVLR